MPRTSAAPGLLYEMLVDGEHINPVLILDEIEKVQKRDDYPNLHQVLYGLLEKHSAGKFRDECVTEVPLDASRITWIATANSLEGIPAPILSRMEVLTIDALTNEQALAVLKSIDERLRVQFKLTDLPPLPPDLNQKLATCSPRVLRQALVGL
ncbi:MAG: AAA family ATPase, partial [Burkholderiales bacterium PBB4]